MGSTEGAEDERPVRELHISPFSMHAKEVTWGMYNECVQAGRCTPAHYDDGKCFQWTGNGFKSVIVPLQYRNEQFPIICVTWFQARDFCRFAGMRLPSEAQWEYAARAGTDNRYSWGDDFPDRCTDQNSNGPRPVGSCTPNRWGLYDMTGNVWEWTSDFYEKTAYAHYSDSNPRGPGAGQYRTIRGGGWYSGPSELRTTNRNWFSPGFAEVSVGFRCVK
ncbi:serine/threonine kinase [Chitinispirillum alkaliphilum]|nr:serine/threonine kinase [Chitinispirillum alkaliphilum]